MVYMSLDQFMRAMAGLSSVSKTERLPADGDVLKVAFSGRPHDYSMKIGSLKDQYDIKQVEVPSGQPAETADGMPILYYDTR